MEHIITADETEDVEIITSWLDWTMTLSHLFNHHNNEKLMPMITDIRHHTNGDFDSCHLLQKLDSQQKPFSAEHWHLSLPAAMIRVALIIAVISFAIWKKCCAQSFPPTVPAQITTAAPVVSP
jgi:hypothetical protein